MRIATRLWLALLAAIVLVLGAGVYLRVRQEERLLLDVTILDRQYFGRALQAALSRQGGGSGDPLQEARAMLGRGEITEAHIEARLVSLTGAHHLPVITLGPSHRAQLARDQVVVARRRADIVTFVPLEGAAVVLELSEPQEHSLVLQRVSWWSAGLQALVLAALVALVSLAVVRRLVGRPLDQLAVFARKIASGDLSARTVPIGRNDEVSTFAREMNSMAERLDSTRSALEAADAERIAALEQLRHADRLRTVGQLASALAHELGTPLNVAAGHARLIEQEPEANKDAKESARTILEQTTRMTKLLRDLLDFARHGGSHRELVDLTDLANHAGETLAPLARRSRVRIELERPSEPIRVNADAQQLLQVVTNLIVNGMQAMPEGGAIRMEIATTHAVAPTGVHAPEGLYARLRVIDEGIGIDPDDLPHLFEPFFTRKKEGEGTGLGLAVVAGIVREHHGWVAVDSKPGHGASFEVFLPVDV